MLIKQLSFFFGIGISGFIFYLMPLLILCHSVKRAGGESCMWMDLWVKHTSHAHTSHIQFFLVILFFMATLTSRVNCAYERDDFLLILSCCIIIFFHHTRCPCFPLVGCCLSASANKIRLWRNGSSWSSIESASSAPATAGIWYRADDCGDEPFAGLVRLIGRRSRSCRQRSRTRSLGQRLFGRHSAVHHRWRLIARKASFR